MIYIYGDSHANDSFKGLTLPNKNYSYSSTMFRVGRDNRIINYNPEDINEGDIILLSYGEIDVRFHIKTQINLGNNEDVIIVELVKEYIKVINNMKPKNVHIILLAIIPPTRQYDYESLHGPITQEHPFVGTDEERVRFTKRINSLLEVECVINGFTFFSPYGYCTREDGTFNYEYSDKTVHLKNNTELLRQFECLSCITPC